MIKTDTSNTSAPQLQAAQRELAKLLLLGPALWLFARDLHRRFTFVADIDWRLMPPLVLDQCRLFSKQDLPWAFFTWAYVSDEVDARLRSSGPAIAPHEWSSGTHPWLIDATMPFGTDEPLLAEVAAEITSKLDMDATVVAWIPGLAGQPVLRALLAKA